MNIKKTKNAQGRINIAISQSYRDAHGKSKSRVIKGLGYLDVIEQEHADPWAFINAELHAAQEHYDKQHIVAKLPIPLDEKLSPEDPSLIKNFGYAALSKLYHALEIDYFINNRRRYTDASYNHNAILKMLVYSRLINPGSKKLSWEQRVQFFDKMDFSLAHVYRSLDFFAAHADELSKAVDARIERLYGRDKSVFYYDVTNYYFEIDREDDLRKRGPSKEHRKTPIIQMGLFLDAQGIPVSYKLFEGNMHDSSTFSPAARDLQANHQHAGSRCIVVADNAMFSGDNIRQLVLHGNGYIIAYSLKGGKEAFKQFAFDPEGYFFIESTTDPNTGKVTRVKRPWNPEHAHAQEVRRFKELVTPLEIWLSNIKGTKKSFQLDAVKLVVTYSPEYAAKAKQERERVLNKTQRVINTGQLFGSQDSRKYILSTPFSKNNGEQVDAEYVYEIDEEKVAYDALFDGFHALITSELDMPASQVIRQYHGLWEIEETFRISKSELKTRPVFVGVKKHITAHFLTCFLALTILRLLDKQLDNQYSTEEILKNLRDSKAYYLGDNLYRFYHTSTCLNDIGKLTGIDFSRKYLTKQEIVEVLAETKKTD